MSRIDALLTRPPIRSRSEADTMELCCEIVVRQREAGMIPQAEACLPNWKRQTDKGRY